MDLNKLLQELNAEKVRLERVIASIEELRRGTGGELPSAPDSERRPGRKAMGPLERQEVSERMKIYWASRVKPGSITLSPASHAQPSPSIPAQPDGSASLP
jgi:hypothetical protein